jgi:hypothetical protein
LTKLDTIKAAWEGGLKASDNIQSLKERGYKYLAVTMANRTRDNESDANYYTYYTFGRSIPLNNTMLENNNGAACNYGGTSTSATKFKVGRKGDSYIQPNATTGSLKNPGDTHPGNTWRIYDLELI